MFAGLSVSSRYHTYPMFDANLTAAAKADPDFMAELNAIETIAAELEIDHPLRKIDFFHLDEGKIVMPFNTLQRHFRNGEIDTPPIWRVYGQDEAEYCPTFPSKREKKKRDAKAKRILAKSIASDVATAPAAGEEDELAPAKNQASQSSPGRGTRRNCSD